MATFDIELVGKIGSMALIRDDETASVISTLVHAQYLLIFTSADGIYSDPSDPTTLIEKVEGKNADELILAISDLQSHCIGASRPDAGGAKAKLEFIKEPVRNGTTVIIASPKYKISDVIAGNSPRTIFRVR